VAADQGTQQQPRTLYEAVGGEPTFHRIVARFYELVAVDEVLRPMYPEEDLAPAEERMRLFLMQHWGGPARYTELRGPARIGARHLKFRIARPHRDAWLRAMWTAVSEAGLEDAHRDRIWNHMETLAWNLTTHAAPRA
jgi:hemoglobin